MKKVKKNTDKLNEYELNYNDRLDGYGIGPPEYMDDKQPYEKDRQRYPEVPPDEFGQRNQYGPVDQYNFRDTYERRWSRPNTYLDEIDDWREWDEQRFENDDYSRMAGHDYRGPEDNFSIGERDNKYRNQYPGVSGKTRGGRTWINRDQYDEQRSFMGKGPRGYHRSDDRIYEEVCEALMRHREIDASDIGVKVEQGLVILEGKVDSRRMKRLAEEVAYDLPGVQDVRNELTISRSFSGGPDEATRNDLGIG